MKYMFLLIMAMMLFSTAPLTAQATVKADIHTVKSNINGLGTSH